MNGRKQKLIEKKIKEDEEERKKSIFKSNPIDPRVKTLLK